MNLEATIRRMTAFPGMLRAVVSQFSKEELRWRPSDGGWSVLEILGHLVSEEQVDFRQRLRLTLENNGAEWPGIDPEGHVREAAYNHADPMELLDHFSELRENSVRWMTGLRDSDWSLKYVHPSIGVLRAGDLLASWSAHDALHLRQLSKRMYQLTVHQNSDFDVRYAGEWRA